MAPDVDEGEVEDEEGEEDRIRIIDDHRTMHRQIPPATQAATMFRMAILVVGTTTTITTTTR